MKPRKGIRNVLAFGTLVLLVLVLFVGLPMNASADPTTIYVDDVPGSGPGNPAEDYTSIQAAINAASAGDTIYIYSGTYYEQLTVTKTLTLEGENKDTTIIQSPGGWYTRGIYEYGISGVTVKNLNFQGFYYGIYLYNSGSTTITNNVITGNTVALYLYLSPSSTITDNTVKDNTYYGISLSSSNSCTLADNTVKNNVNNFNIYMSNFCTLTGNTVTGPGTCGIKLSRSNSCTMTNNVMANNDQNFCLDGYSITDYNQNIDSTNTVDGKPIYYLKGVYDVELNSVNSYKDAGFIGIIGSDKVTIKDLAFSHNSHGILVVDSTNTVIQNVDISYSGQAIYLYYSDYGTITDTTVANNDRGIYQYYSDSSTITDNTIQDNNYGIHLFHSEGSTIKDNTVTGNNQAIYLMNAGSSTLTCNSVTSNKYGFHVNLSPSSTVSDNTANDNTGYGISIVDWSYYTTVTNNTITNNNEGLSVKFNSFITVTGNNITGNTQNGLYMYYADSCTVTSNTITGSYNGLVMTYSSPNTLKNNVIAANNYNFGVTGNVLSDFPQNIDTTNTVDGKPIYFLDGLSNVEISSKSVYKDAGYLGIFNSDQVTIKDMSFSNNIQGILLIETKNTVIQNLDISNIQNGIYMQSCNSITVTDNTFTNIAGVGIHMVSSGSSTVTGNTLTSTSTGVYLHLCDFSLVSGNTVSNSVNGINLFYSSSCTVTMNTITGTGLGTGLTLSLLNDCYVNCNTISGNRYGLSVSNANSNTIKGNTVVNNMYGIYLYRSSSNTLTCNKVANNMYCIYAFFWADDNNIYHNNFIDNTIQVYTYYATNTWDNGYPSGGNYWSDYTGSDTNNDGIGDTPYVISLSENDNYPLMTAWGPEDSIDELIDDIEAMELHVGMEDSLVSKLEEVLDSIAEEEYKAASNQLGAFINQVEAQRGKKLTEEQADQLVTAAEIVIYMLSAWM